MLPNQRQRTAGYAFAGAATLTCALVMLSLTASAQSGNTQPARMVVAQPGAKIVSQLQPTDSALEVVSSETMPLVVEPPPGQSAAEFYASASDVVLLLGVTAARARLTDGGDFVQTDVDASVVEVLKSDASTPIPSSVRFSFAGGVVSVGGKPVRGTVPWSKQVRVGGQYLVFATIDKTSGQLVFGPASTFERQGDEFVSLLTKGPSSIRQLSGTSATVLQSIRK